MKTLIVIVLLLSLGPASAIDAVEKKAAAREIANEMAECATYFGALAELERRHDVPGSEERATNYDSIHRDMVTGALGIVTGLGYSDDQALGIVVSDPNARFKNAQQAGQITALMARFGPFCNRLLQHLDDRATEILAGNICDRDYPCRANLGF